MTVGLELVCWAGTADANATKNKKRTLTSLHFIRTSCFEELPNSPRLLRTVPPSYCPLGRGLYCPLGEAEHSIFARVRLIGSRGGPKKVASDTNISRFHRKSQLLVIAALVQATFASDNTEVIAWAVYMRCHIHLIMRGRCLVDVAGLELGPPACKARESSPTPISVTSNY